MSLATAPGRPLACLKQALRSCRLERRQQRFYATTEIESNTPPAAPIASQAKAVEPRAEKQDVPLAHAYPSLDPDAAKNFRLQDVQMASRPEFRPGHAIKQNRPDAPSLKRIKIYPSPVSAKTLCVDPIAQITQSQLTVLDPTGARTRLFSAQNPERVKPGDILLVRLKSGDPFAGVVLDIRQRNSPIDTAVLLRNSLTRIGVEMWYKVYSPNVEGIEIVQRRARRARRAKLTYMRKPKHDIGSVENIVRAYQKTRLGGPALGGSQDKSALRKGKKR